MPEPLFNPHDHFFKELFSRQDTAQEFLRHYLPAQVVELLELSSREIRKDSFVDPNLSQHFSDLLYQVALRDGGQGYIYLLFEHKSYPDPLTALQLLGYLVRIWEQSLKQGEKLQPIIPLVLYHGQSRWRVGQEFRALFESPVALQPYLPNYRYELYDLSRYEDEEIKGQVILRVGLLLLKHILVEDVGERLGEILGLLRTLGEQRTGLAYLETILRYISGGTDKVTVEELQQVVSQVFEEGVNLMPTIAEQWFEQGLVKGREEGREEGVELGLVKGREEGREEGVIKGREATLKVLRRFLAQRFGIPLTHFDKAFEKLTLAALVELSDVAFEVDSLAEFETALNLVTAG
ncbi:MAG: Rpn family recombination-promoting nuclease/putative transposase [Anaerolineae bacterium]